MNEKLTQVEKWINEAQLTRAESEALEENLGFLQDENARLRKVLRGVYGMVAGLKKFETRHPRIMAMARECLKDGEE